MVVICRRFGLLFSCSCAEATVRIMTKVTTVNILAQSRNNCAQKNHLSCFNSRAWIQLQALREALSVYKLSDSHRSLPLRLLLPAKPQKSKISYYSACLKHPSLLIVVSLLVQVFHWAVVGGPILLDLFDMQHGISLLHPARR